MRRESGKEKMVQGHRDEDVASHIDPKSCAAHGDEARDVRSYRSRMF